MSVFARVNRGSLKRRGVDKRFDCHGFVRMVGGNVFEYLVRGKRNTVLVKFVLKMKGLFNKKNMHTSS